MVSTAQRDAPFIHDLTPLIRAEYEYLRYTNERSVRDAFLAGDIEEPDLVYRDCEFVDSRAALDDITALESVVAAFHDAVVRHAYLPKLKELRTVYRLLQAALRGDDQAVGDASQELYGAPRMDLFHYSQRICGAMMDCADEYFGTHPDVREALTVLRPGVRQGAAAMCSYESIPLPTVKHYPASEPLSAAAVQEQCERALASAGVEGWCVVVDTPGSRVSFNTNHALKTIFVPSDTDLRLRTFPLTRERVDAIIAHEIGTHVVRRVRGEASPLALLGVGLAGYLRGEEGVATYAEQVRDGTRHFAGGLGYLAIGWARGLDGTPRTFRGLHTMLVAYFLVAALEHAIHYGEAVDVERCREHAEHRAWARCVRTFRGTSGTTPGACFTKDIVYREGNMAIWELATRDPAWVSHFFLGKYDPTKEEHVALLSELGMITHAH